MKFVDTSYWIDAYNAHGSGSIFFANANIPGYKGNGDMVKLRAEDRDSAQAYIIWDKEYLYVLFDVNDDDIAPASGDHYDTDSVEFFLDEDFDRPTSYMGDEIQVRVDAIDGAFSANEAGTSAYEYVARAVQLKTDADGKNVGYQVQYVIPFMNEHKSGDIMGMDLQINDCFTVESEGTDEDGNPTTVYSPDRAGTLTAYDTTNNAYADPSCFGRVKLYDKDFVDPDADPLPLEPTDGEAVRTESAIVVDGTIDDAWDATDYVEVANYSGTAGDTTAQSKMMWDKDYLYGLVVVNDTSIDKSNTNAWEQDGIEFFLDEDYSKEATYELNTDAFQYRFTGFELEAKENEEDEDVWKAAITNVIATGSADARLSYAEIRVEYEVTATGYVVEYAIPWVSEVATNQVVGFELTVMDCTDGVRNNEISLLGDGGRALYSTPSLMGSLRLVEPKEAPGIDLSGAAALYGTGNVSYNNETGVLTGSGLDGLLIPLGKTIPEGESISITVYGSAPVGARVWLSDSANKRYSDIQTMEFGTTYELTSSNIESGTTCTHFQIKGSAYGVSFDSIEITKVVIE